MELLESPWTPCSPDEDKYACSLTKSIRCSDRTASTPPVVISIMSRMQIHTNPLSSWPYSVTVWADTDTSRIRLHIEFVVMSGQESGGIMKQYQEA